MELRRSNRPAPLQFVARSERFERGSVLTPQVVGALVRRYGHFDIAEDAVQEALITAATRWPVDGLPPSPQGWIVTGYPWNKIDTPEHKAFLEAYHVRETHATGQLGDEVTTQYDVLLPNISRFINTTAYLYQQLAMPFDIRVMSGSTPK